MPDAASASDYMTSSEVAAKLRFTVRGINRMAANGSLPGATKIGRKWLFDRHKLAGYLRSQERRPDQWHPSINEAKRGGAVPSVPESRSDGRLERLLGLKLKSASRNGSKS